ncbi:MAG: hypothetical protein RBT47_11325 [Anaerolineae bacterium]|jgi:hypothetical protein|nr:hypothetical protein [Anaerolineae bacterium]
MDPVAVAPTFVAGAGEGFGTLLVILGATGFLSGAGLKAGAGRVVEEGCRTLLVMDEEISFFPGEGRAAGLGLDTGFLDPDRFTLLTLGDFLPPSALCTLEMLFSLAIGSSSESLTDKKSQCLQ